MHENLTVPSTITHSVESSNHLLCLKPWPVVIQENNKRILLQKCTLILDDNRSWSDIVSDNAGGLRLPRYVIVSCIQKEGLAGLMQGKPSFCMTTTKTCFCMTWLFTNSLGTADISVSWLLLQKTDLSSNDRWWKQSYNGGVHTGNQLVTMHSYNI